MTSLGQDRRPSMDDPSPKSSSSEISARMRRTGRRDTAAELAIRRELHRRGYRYRVDQRPSDRMRTRADILFTRWRVAVFVDGCFWHGCPEHGTAPKANAVWWREKITANIARDRRADAALAAEGWLVVRIWEHEEIPNAVARVEEALGRRRADRTE
jgi:DNA mismatch endonuclease, patch repair protein